MGSSIATPQNHPRRWEDHRPSYDWAISYKLWLVGREYISGMIRLVAILKNKEAYWGYTNE